MHTCFLPDSAKGTSEVTQNAQFILTGLRVDTETMSHSDSNVSSEMHGGHRRLCLITSLELELLDGNISLIPTAYM